MSIEKSDASENQPGLSGKRVSAHNLTSEQVYALHKYGAANDTLRDKCRTLILFLSAVLAITVLLPLQQHIQYQQFALAIALPSLVLGFGVYQAFSLRNARKAGCIKLDCNPQHLNCYDSSSRKDL